MQPCEGPLLILLHGLATNGTVWQPLEPWLQAHWSGRWMAPDLPGHGSSIHVGPFNPMVAAAFVANVMKSEKDVYLVGHSMGGVIALTLATGWFGVLPRAAIALSTKCEWSEEDHQRRTRMATKPRRWFDSREEAVAHYLHITGLSALVDPASPIAEAGIRLHEGRFTLASDPGIYGTAVPVPVDMLLQQARSPVMLATGEQDAIAPVEPLRRLRPDTELIPWAGHNFHLSSPAAVGALIDRCRSAHGSLSG